MTDHLKTIRSALESCEPGDWSTGHVLYPVYDEQAVDKALAALAALEQAMREPVAIEFDGYEGIENVRWYINELHRVRYINQWLADVYCNKLREFYTAENSAHNKDQRGAEVQANNAIADLANAIKKHVASYWMPGAEVPDMTQFERIHDEVTKRLLAVFDTPPAQQAKYMFECCLRDALSEIAADPQPKGGE
jgi:hypothetical protein